MAKLTIKECSNLFIDQTIIKRYNMDRYFEDMLPAEELEQLKFIPTISEFVTWIEQKWHDLPALSDTERTARKRDNDVSYVGTLKR